MRPFSGSGARSKRSIHPSIVGWIGVILTKRPGHPLKIESKWRNTAHSDGETLGNSAETFRRENDQIPDKHRSLDEEGNQRVAGSPQQEERSYLLSPVSFGRSRLPLEKASQIADFLEDLEILKRLRVK